MALTQLSPPFPIFTDRTGRPLDGGYLYFGEVDQDPETAPITVYFDSALTQPAVQPLRTSAGYVMRDNAPALLYAASKFSVTVKDKQERLVIYAPSTFGLFDETGLLFAENNLSDVADADAALVNLGVTSTAAELNALDGVTSVGTAVVRASTQAAARTAIGATATGSAVFTAADQAAGRTALGAMTTGANLFTANTQENARTVLGAHAVAEIGAYMLLWVGLGGTFTIDTGDVISGANLLPANAAGDSAGVGYSGTTWRCMGRATNGTSAQRTTLFVRVT